MAKGFHYRIIHQDKTSLARVGEMITPHGTIHTPAFVPVGTQATVKSLTPDELKLLDVELFFVNTYHMVLRPGIAVIQKFKGLHNFMNWHGPLITDSGGFQVFSLARNKFISQKNDAEKIQLVKISGDGVEFRSHWDGTKHYFTPESSMEMQWQLGADIHIAFDECTSYPVNFTTAKTSMQRTHEWAIRSLKAHQQQAKKSKNYQALYGSIQGSIYQDLRQESAKFISVLDFDGVAIGGVAVGESKQEMAAVCDWVVPLLPTEKPRHLLGVGEIDDIFTIIERGIDTFDCVQPTRLARMGELFQNPKSEIPMTKTLTVDITKKIFASDLSPLDKHCTCYSCTNFSRAYIHHLFRVRELLAYRLATIHNLHFVIQLTKTIRQHIQQGTYASFKAEYFARS